ncbi:MAG: pentapeptide repeat-containing protein [Brasilonema angustatum HA4187-MV1]|jgi:uncharacterized protein YjbI with pentapeptide repeats|nr:pentapeptide repeat-containing protein [Brasilonema angustatum HA4187-MV1]
MDLTSLTKKLAWLTPNKLLIGVISILVVAAILVVFPPLTIQKGAWVWADWTGLSSEPDVSIVTETIEKNGEITTIKRITTKEPESGATLIEWVNTLIVPFSLTVLGALFQQQQEKRAEEQAELDKEIANINLCEEALQAYFDRLAELLLDKKLSILSKDDPVQEVALNVIRARTLSILRRLGEDRERKGNVVRFLIDAELMSKLNLSDADFRNADMAGINLEDTDLRGADLENADLSDSDLRGAKLEKANLLNANLAGIKLENVDLREANLKNTNLMGAKLLNANLRSTILENANLSGARLENANLRSARLANANLSGARLENASLVNADLGGAKLEKTNLLNANLSGARLKNANLLNANLAGADLRGADLRDAVNMNAVQIEAANNKTEAMYDERSRQLLGLSLKISSG